MESEFICPRCGAGNSEFNPECASCGHDLPLLSFGGPASARVEADPGSEEKINDRFEILNLLGKGGMGVVYRAFDHLLGREVAVKVLPLQQEHTIREARTVSSLNHPQIVTVFDFLQQGSNCYLVMELVEGETLAEILKHGRLSLERALQMGIQVAEALNHAHSAGMVHCDIKPGNIMVTTGDRIKVLDFGLAAYLDDRDRVEGKPQGTLVYMSPEQIRGEPLDTRSDMFSFGVVLYQMMTGRHPFFTTSTENPLHQLLHADHKPPDLDDVHLERSLSHLFAKMLAKDQQGRIAGASVLKRDLESLQKEMLGAAVKPITQVPDAEEKKGVTRYLLWGLLALMACLFFLWRTLPSEGGKPMLAESTKLQTAGIPGKRGLAVLPLKLMDGIAGDEILRDGILETLTNQLAGLEGSAQAFSIVPANLVRDMKLKTAMATQAAVGADFVLEGTLQRLPNGLRVVLHFVDARNNEILASKSVLGGPHQLAELQDRIAQAAIEMVDPSLAFQPLDQESQAYEYLLRGKGHFASWQTGTNLEQAILFFEKAVETDPQSPGAHAFLGHALVNKFRVKEDQEALARATKHASKALTLSPHIAEVWLVLGMISREKGEFEEAIEQFEESHRLNPLNTNSLVELGKLHRYRKQWELAENAYRRAISERNSSWRPRYNLGVLFFQLGRYDDAEAELLEATQVAPGKYLNYQMLGGIYQMTGKPDLALAQYQKALAIKPTASVYSNLGTLHYYSGQFEKAAEAYRGALTFWKENYLVWANLGDASRFTTNGSLESKNAYEQALRLLRIKRKRDPNNANWQIHEALFLSRMGHLEQALEILGEGIPTQEVQELYNLALIYELTGQRNKAFSKLGMALSKGLGMEDINNEPDFKALRRDPNFMELKPKGEKDG